MNVYRVTVFTGNKLYGGANADVEIAIFGDLGNSGVKTLDTERNVFQTGS